MFYDDAFLFENDQLLLDNNLLRFGNDMFLFVSGGFPFEPVMSAVETELYRFQTDGCICVVVLVFVMCYGVHR